MQNSKGLRKLQNKLGLKKQANNGGYRVLLDQNSGIALLVDSEGKVVHLPKPKDTNSPEWAQYQFLVDYNNRLNNPYGLNEEGGVPIVFGADILGSQLQRSYIKPGNPSHGSRFTKDDTYSQVVYNSNPDNPVNLLNVIKNLAFADAEFRGMHYGSNISPHRAPVSVDFSDIFKAYKLNQATQSGLLTHLNQSVVDPENTNTTVTNPLHKWYPSEIEDFLRARGYKEHLIMARPTSDVDTVAGRAAESPFDAVYGGYALAGNQLWSLAFGDNDYMKTMNRLQGEATTKENENRFTRFVPVHQQAAYRTIRELEKQGQLKDPFFVNGNMFYIAPTTVTEGGEELEVWNPDSTFVDLANRKDQELINIENALGDENALQEAVKAINATMYEGAPQPTFSSPQAQLLYTVLDNNRQEFYKLDEPKVLEDGRRLLYNIDDMPIAFKQVSPYYRPINDNKREWHDPGWISQTAQAYRNADPNGVPAGYIYKVPSLTDFALLLNTDADDYTGRAFVDSAGRKFVTQSDDLPLYRHTSANLNPTTDAEAYDAINGANYGWQNRNYGLYPIKGNPYAQLITGGILESAYLRKRDSDQLLRILSGLNDSDINRGIKDTGNRDSTRPTPYLYHYYSTMGFDPSTARVPADPKIFGWQAMDNQDGRIAIDTPMTSDRVRHMRTSDFSKTWEGWAHDAGKWVQQKVVGLGGSESDGAVLGELTQLGAGIFNPQMLVWGVAESPVAWMNGTGNQQSQVDFDVLSRLSGADLTSSANRDLFLNSDAFWTWYSAYQNPNSAMAGLPQDLLGDIATIPFVKGMGKTVSLAGRGAGRLVGGRLSIPPVQGFVARGPIIKGNAPSVLNDLTSSGNLRISQSGAALVYNGKKPITLQALESSNALVENGRGKYMRAADLENAARNGVDISSFYKPGEQLTLHASPSEIAAASSGKVPLSMKATAGASIADAAATGGTLPDVAYNILHPIKAYRGWRYDMSRNASRAPFLTYEPFRWEQLFGKSVGPRRSNTFSYDPKTNTLVSNKPVQGLTGVHGGGRWNPLNWSRNLVYDAEGHMRPVLSPFIGRRSFSRVNSFTVPNVQVNIDPRLQPINRVEPGELRNTANYYTPSTYNDVIDEYANNDYINRSKLPKGEQSAGTSAWPWLAIGGAGLGLGLLLSNRKKEEEEERKRKKLMQQRRLQEYDNYYNEYSY